MIIPPPDFRILSQNASKSSQQDDDVLALERELGVENIELDGQEKKMDMEYSFRSLKIEMKDLLKSWRTVTEKPS